MAIGVCLKGVEVGEVARAIATTQFKIQPLQCNWIVFNEKKINIETWKFIFRWKKKVCNIIDRMTVTWNNELEF